VRDDRLRQGETIAEFDRLPDDQLDGSQGELLQTYTETTYPTVAGRVYACHPVWIDADDTEGATPTFTVDTDITIYALNVGSQIPASGTKVIGHLVGGRWVFRWSVPP